MIDYDSLLSNEVVFYVITASLCITIFDCLFLLPMIFNFKIIPGIEKKIKKKLKFTFISYEMFFFRDYFARYCEISLYILMKYLRISKKMNSRCALVKAEYHRELFSKFEIFWSFFSLFNYLIFFACLFIITHGFSG